MQPGTRVGPYEILSPVGSVGMGDGAAKVARILGQARTRGELSKYLETPLDELLKLLKGKEAES